MRRSRRAFPSCTHTGFLDAHHIEHWVDGGATELDNLVLLCRRYHTFVHEYGYRIEWDALRRRPISGRAGEFAALSEFLLRGYNVAIPSIDVGDDAFVINDADGTTWRVQVKTGDVSSGKGGKRSATYNLSRSQLREPKPAELFFMFMARWSDRWHYVLIRRDHLEQIRRSFERGPRLKKAGAKPKTDATAKGDALSVVFTWGSASATAWGTTFTSYFDTWPKAELPEINAGPGATKPRASRSPRRQR